jgi:hypothetical protein
MAMRAEKVFCVLEYARIQSIVMAQRRFRTKFGKDLPVKNSIKQWYEKFQCDGCLCNAKHAGQPGPSEGRVERVREAFQRSPRKSGGMQNKLGKFLLLSVSRMLPSIAPFTCTNSLQCVRELSKTPYSVKTVAAFVLTRGLIKTYP